MFVQNSAALCTSNALSQQSECPNFGSSSWVQQQTMHALQHELGNVNLSRFACTAEDPVTDTNSSWYDPGPDVLQQLTPDGIAEDPHDSAWTVHPEGKWIIGNHPEASDQQKQQLVDMLMRNKQAFAYTLDDLPGHQGDPVTFQLIDPNKRMWCPPRPHTEHELEFGDEKMKEMLDAGIVVEIPTTNPHAAAITLPMKRAVDGSWTDKRFCVDLRKTNENTVIDKYGMPLPEDLFRRIGGARFLAKIDLRSGFWQIRLSPESQKHVAFWWRGRLYAYTRLPFGHVNATAIFQRVVEAELQSAGASKAAVYVDDIIVWSDTMEEHIQQLEHIFQHFHSVGLRAHPAKTVVAAETIGYLGHLVSATELKPEEAKVAAIKALQPPNSVKRLQAHLGLFNYYRGYVPEFSRIAQPLYQLLKKGVEFLWTPLCQRAYDALKHALCKPGLALRQPIAGEPFHLYVDWSTHGIAAVLNQKQDGREFMIACASRSLNPAEQNYPAWKGEMLAAVYGIKLFRPYLLAREFYLHTDHRALLWLLTNKNPVGQQMRWVLALQEYRFTIVHRAGASNPADVPSREPVSCAADSTGARLDYQLQDWPLPKVITADGKPDTVSYTHDSLSRQLGITGNSSKVAAMATASYETAATEFYSPAAALAQAQAMPSVNASQLQYEALHCLLASNETELDRQMAATSDTLLGGGSGALFSASDSAASDTQHPAVAWRQQDLQKAASSWVTLAGFQQPAEHVALPGSYTGAPDRYNVRSTEQLNTSICSNTFFPSAHEQGIVLWEPFGGICAGLEMALRNGFMIKQYIYSDIDPLAQQVAAHRIRKLQSMYPLQLSESAIAGYLTTLPADVGQIQTEHMYNAIQSAPVKQWLIVAGWPCQDLSSAGPSTGLNGNRSRLLYDLVRTVGILQQLSPDQPPAYLFENVPFQHHRSQQIAVQDFAAVQQMIGEPVVLDAAQFGSLAHRARNFWTNLCTPPQLNAALQFVHRPPNRTVQDMLPPGRVAQPVRRADYVPQYPCNVPGQERKALPTLMSRPGSYAFRPGQAGSILDCSDPLHPRWDEPTAQEREWAMGYLPDSTAAEGVTQQQRCVVLGQSMDANALQAILAISHAWWLQQPASVAATGQTSFCGMACFHDPIKQNCNLHDQLTSHMPLSTQFAVGMAAEFQEQTARSSHSSGDVWTDASVIQYLKDGSMPAEADAAEKQRIARRAKHYSFIEQHLIRSMPDGSRRIVPDGSVRQQLIKQQHELCGHYGIRRTAAMLLTKYWWYGLLADVTHVVSHCEHCSRVQASFTAKPEQLQPIPISSMGFRWHVDLAGPFPTSTMGNKYIMIAVEAFSKHLEAVPIKDKEADTVAFAFLHNVIARFGAPGQVVTDSGTEFKGGFAQLLLDSMIDHAVISTDRPQSNGQAEKMVQTVKRALMKMCAAKKAVTDWDTNVAWLTLGYRCSPQRSTGFTPYELLYGRKPVVPPAASNVLTAEIDYDNPQVAAADLLRRKELIQQLCPMALENLAIAQHRDQLRYLQVRAPDYQPRMQHFKVGDFVYVQQLQRYSALQPRAQQAIYRIVEIRDSGVFILQGKCGRTMSMHMSHCSPCHLPGIDSSIDPRLAEVIDDIVCEVCNTDQREDLLLICDFCNSGYHTFCLTPALTSVPDGGWLCPACVQQGRTPAEVASRDQQRQELQQRDSQPVLFPNAAMRRRDEEAASLHGRTVRRAFKDPSTGQTKQYWGVVHFRGALARPNYFSVVYEDSDWEIMSKQQLKKILQPEGTSLPANVQVSIPAEAIAATVQMPTTEVLQHSIRHGKYVTVVPSVTVPAYDIKLLMCKLQLALAQQCMDPITCSAQWQALVGNLPFSAMPATDIPAGKGASVLFMSPVLQYALHSLRCAMRMKPALIVSYVPSLRMPHALWQLYNAMRAQQHAIALRAHAGWWLLVTKKPLKVSHWLN